MGFLGVYNPENLKKGSLFRMAEKQKGMSFVVFVASCVLCLV
jgi:hypothetical protein